MKNLKDFPTVVALATLLAIAPAALASTAPAGANDATIQAQLVQKLQQKSEFKDVKSTVENGTITLTGSVDSYRQKLDAQKLARKAGKQVGVRDLIEVAGPSIPDAQLQQKLAGALAYDRVGYGDTAFNVITLDVKNGVVTLGGEVADTWSYSDALGIVQNAKGVKDLISTVKVAPASPFDDGLRVRLFRAIYGDSILSKYGADPVKPIRILVDGGHVALYGRVDNQTDVNIAGIRAKQVFGAFSVDNHLTTSPTDVVR